jgi:hypothetical protein
VMTTYCVSAQCQDDIPNTFAPEGASALSGVGLRPLWTGRRVEKIALSDERPGLNPRKP